MVSQYLEVSSRIQAIESGASHGASCNTFVVQDTVIGTDGIAEMLKWCAAIPSVQGAPTIILSNLRGRGEMTSRGVTIQGACELTKVIDSIVTYMKRPGKKNSACVCFLDANHPDLDEWLSQEFTYQLQTVYLGVLLYPGKEYTRETLEKLAKAYEAKRIFICKVTQDQFGNLLAKRVCVCARTPDLG